MKTKYYAFFVLAAFALALASAQQQVCSDDTCYLQGNLNIALNTNYCTGSSCQQQASNDNISNSHYSDSGCSTTWDCSDWGICADGMQTRNCQKANVNCYAGAMPSLTQTCTIPTDNQENQTSNVDNQNTNTDDKNDQTGTTGASPAGNIIWVAAMGIVLIAIIGIAIYLTVSKKKQD